jgi:hypothetical protein
MDHDFLAFVFDKIAGVVTGTPSVFRCPVGIHDDSIDRPVGDGSYVQPLRC